MQDHRSLRMLTRYTAWANDRLFTALDQLPPGEVTAPRATSFGNMLRSLAHVFSRSPCTPNPLLRCSEQKNFFNLIYQFNVYLCALLPELHRVRTANPHPLRDAECR